MKTQEIKRNKKRNLVSMVSTEVSINSTQATRRISTGLGLSAKRIETSIRRRFALDPSIWILTGLMLIGLLGMASMSLAAEGAWTRKADMPTPRVALSTSVVNGIIYAIGGGPSDLALSTVEAYDPETDSWTKKANMPTARWYLGTSVVNGIIYAIGGGTYEPEETVVPLSAVEAYNPATDSWTKKADMPTARFSLSTSVVNGKIYAIGGNGEILTRRSWGLSLSTVEAYDPATDSWTKKADMPTPRHVLSTAAVNGKIYAFGGQPTPWAYLLSTVEEYDPATDSWTKKADMLRPTLAPSTSVVNGIIYAIGGWSGIALSTGGWSGIITLSTVEAYDPKTDSWTKKADMPTARLCLSTSEVNGRIYAIGGGGWAWNVALPEGVVEEYTPEGWPFVSVSPQGKLATTWGKIKR